MDNRKTFIVSLAFMALMPPSELLAISIREAMYKAVNTNPEVLAAEQKRLATEKKIRQAFSGFLPKIDFSSGAGREFSDNSTTRSLKDSGVTLQRTELGLSLSQMLFDGSAVKNDVEIAQAQWESTNHRYSQAVEAVARDAVLAYLELIKQYELMELTKDNVNLHKLILEQSIKRSDGGVGSIADVHQTESRLALASARLTAIDGSMRNAEEKFVKVIDTKPKELSKPSLDQSLLPKTEFAAEELALKQHPAILSALADLDATQASLNRTGSDFMPKLNLELGGSNNNNVSGSEGSSNNVFAMLRMKFNIFNGGSDVSRRQEAMRLMEQSQELLEKERRIVKENVNVAWNSFKVSKDRLSFLKKHVSISQNVTVDYHEQFDTGRRTLLDVLNAENELFQARSAYVMEEYNMLGSVYELLERTGSLVSSMGIGAEELPEGEVKYVQKPEIQENRNEDVKQEKEESVKGVNIIQTPPPSVLSSRDSVRLPTENILSQNSQEEGDLTSADILFLKGVLSRLSNHFQGLTKQQKPVAQDDALDSMVSPKNRSGIQQENVLPDNNSMPQLPKGVIDTFTPEERDVYYKKLSDKKIDSRNKLLDVSEAIPEKTKLMDTPSDAVVQPASALKQSVQEEFVVLLGTFRAEKDDYIARITSKLIANGFSIFHEEIRKNGNPHKMVFCGPFPVKEESEKALKSLKSQFGLSGIIGSRKKLIEDKQDEIKSHEAELQEIELPPSDEEDYQKLNLTYRLVPFEGKFDGKGYFAVRAGSFTNIKNAEKLQLSLTQANVANFNEMIALDGKNFIRIYLGPFSDDKETVKNLPTIQRKFKLPKDDNFVAYPLALLSTFQKNKKSTFNDHKVASLTNQQHQ